MSEEEQWQTWQPRRGRGFKIIVWVILALIALGTTVALVLMVLG